jgi:hypothetical protein
LHSFAGKSAFATVRRTECAKGCFSKKKDQKTALAMIFKLDDAAEESWRSLDAQYASGEGRGDGDWQRLRL